MQKSRSHKWDVGIQGCRVNKGRINEGRLYCVVYCCASMYYTWSIQKIMRLFLQKMHNIKIQIFQFIFFKFSNASFKTNITFCYLAFKFWVYAQWIAQKCILRRLALVQVWLFISNTKIVLPNQKFNYWICIILSFTKFECWAIVSLI